MKSLKARFLRIQKQNPMWSSYLCFMSAIGGQNFSRETIVHWYGRLIEKGDCDRKERPAIFNDMVSFSKDYRGHPNLIQKRPFFERSTVQDKNILPPPKKTNFDDWRKWVYGGYAKPENPK